MAQMPSLGLNIKIYEVNEVLLIKGQESTKKNKKSEITLSENQVKMFIHFINYAVQDKECNFEEYDFIAEISFVNGTQRIFYFNQNCITEDKKTWHNIAEPEFLIKIWDK